MTEHVTTTPNLYPKKGSLSVIPAADLAADDSPANSRGPARLGDAGIGKRAGMIALRDNGGGDMDLVIASGDAPTDPWFLFEAGTAVTPA